MLEFVRGNLFEAEVDALVNTVNTVGVMGKGIALQFSRSFPEIVQPYKEACESGSLTIGTVQTIRLPLLQGVASPKYVINFPTKKHWKGNSQIEFIESGLHALREEVERLHIRSVAIPPLGCGLGGLSWSDVRLHIERVFAEIGNLQVLVFEPVGKPVASSMKSAIKKPNMTAGRAALLGLMRRYIVPLMDDAVTLLELHKLMYFMQEAGEPLRLQFVKGRYGPYATNLRHVLNAIEGHYVTGFGDASEEPGKVLEPSPKAIEKAERHLRSKSKSETLERFNRVEQLIDGFETAYGMELLSSVHWVAKHESAPAHTQEEAVSLIHDWNDRKRKSFASEHIQVAWNRLAEMDWL